MFNAIKNKIAAAKKMNQDKILMRILKDPLLDAQIVDLNQKQLYEQGIQADGTPTGNYRPSTIQHKLAEGDSWNVPGRVDHITGNDTGETYRSMHVLSLPAGLVIAAVDRNHFFEGANYRPAIAPFGLGLTPASIEQIKPQIKEQLREEVRKEIA